MNRKKLLYIGAIIVVLGLGYINYFGDEKKIEPKAQVIETTDVTYDSDGYHIKADKQKDIMKTDETTFETATAKFKDMLLSGDNVFLDKAKNLILKSNILGRSINGWEFKTQEANYTKENDTITSTVGVSAINKEKGIEISGNNFKTNSKMSYIDLTGNVVLKINGYSIYAESAYYNNEDKIVNILGNMKLEGEISSENSGKLTGEFKKAKYDLNTKILETKEPFVVDYNGTKLLGEHLIYNENTGALSITENVKILVDGYTIDVKSITRKDLNSPIDINGEIKGSNGIYTFKADKGVFFNKTGILELVGNIDGYSKNGEKIQADKMDYNKNTGIMNLYGYNKDIYYSKEHEIIRTKELIYNNKTQEIAIKKNYIYKSDIYKSEGKQFFYNKLTGKGKIVSGYVKDLKKDEYASGDLVNFNRTEDKYLITGNGYFESKDYAFKSNLIDYRGQEDKVILPEKYEFIQKKDKGILKGDGGLYTLSTGEFIDKGPFVYEDNNSILRGIDLTYNTKTGIGSIGKNVEIDKKDDGTKVTGDRGEFLNGDYAKIIGNLKIDNPKVFISGNDGTYKFAENTVYIPGKVKFIGKEKQISGDLVDGVYKVQESKFIGKNFNGKDMNNSIKSDIINYYVNRDEVVLKNNCYIDNAQGTLESNLINYQVKNNIAIMKEKFTINYKEFKIVSTNGQFNLQSNVFSTGNVNITSKMGDKFTANESKGNMQNMVVDLLGNAQGTFIDKGTITNFSGDSVRAYLKEENKTYTVQRVEALKNAKIVREDMTLTSNYLEMDVPRNLVFSKEKSKIVLNNEKGLTTITSKTMDGDLNTEILNLNVDVKIVNKNKNGEITTLTSNKAIVKNKENIVDLLGDVIADNAKATIDADSAIYNTNTNKIKAKGNVFINYKTNDNANTGTLMKVPEKDAYKNFMKQ